jgi:hypothetical protein
MLDGAFFKIKTCRKDFIRFHKNHRNEEIAGFFKVSPGPGWPLIATLYEFHYAP